MATILQLVSKANVALGRRTVPSLSDGSREAEVYSALIDQCITDLGIQSAWRFATKDAVLVNANSTPADPNYTQTYTLPADLGSIRFVMDTGGAILNGRDYVIQSTGLLCSITTGLIMKYVYAMTQATVLTAPDYFQELVWCRLAAEAAEPLTGQADLVNRFVQITSGKFRVACVRDGQTEPLVRLNENTALIGAHRGARTG